MDPIALAVSFVTLLVLLLWYLNHSSSLDSIQQDLRLSQQAILEELRTIRKAIDQTGDPQRRAERYLRGDRNRAS